MIIVSLRLFHSEFSNERVRVERRAKFRKTRTKRLYSTMFNSYYQWISQAGTTQNVNVANIAE